MSATFSFWIIALYLMRELRDIFFARHFLCLKYVLYYKTDVLQITV